MDKLAEWTCCSRVSQWLWRSAVECTSGIVLIRQWSAQPPASFAFIQKGAGVPLQRFWIPVHTLITIGVVASLIVELESRPRRSLVIAALISNAVMRAWSLPILFQRCSDLEHSPRDQPQTAALLGSSPHLGPADLVQRTARSDHAVLLPNCPYAITALKKLVGRFAIS